MDEVPLYVCVGSALRPGLTYTTTGQGGTFGISAITPAGALTVLTLATTSHGFANSVAARATINGVTGADAAQINGKTLDGQWISPNQIALIFDSSALTLTATGTCTALQATLTQWSAPWASQSQFYNWASRIEGVNDGGTQKYRFPGGPGNDSWSPRIWNHDGPPSPPSISTITKSTVTTLTLSAAHGRTAGQTTEVEVRGVTGTDAAQLNGTWTGTFRSTNQIEIPLNSTSLTLTAAGTVRIPYWTYFSDQVTPANSYPITTQTDRTNGGSVNSIFTSSRAWGMTTSFCADLHEIHGPNEERAYVLECANVAPVLGRVPRTITAVTKGTWTRLTVASHQVPQDPGKPFPITLWGFTSDYTPLNGLKSAYYIDATTIEIRSVDSSGYGTYAGGAKTVTDQRWRVAYGEAYADFAGRLADALTAIEDAGDTAVCKGIISTIGYVDIPTNKVDTTATRVGGFRVSSVTTTGYPTTLTLTDSLPYAEATAAAALRYVRLSGAAGLSGLYECRINSPTEIVLHATNSAAIPPGATIEIGDPLFWLTEEVPSLFTSIRSQIATETGQTATDIPFVIVDPIVRTTEQWDGIDAWTSAVIYERWQTSTAAAVNPINRVAKLDTSGILNLTATSPTAYGAIQLGHRASAKIQSMLPAVATPTTRGVPVYMMLGDSYCTGAAPYLDAASGKDPRYDGTDWASDVAAGTRRIKILNHSTVDLEDFGGVRKVGGVQLFGNSVTHPILNLRGDGVALASIVGPDQTFALEARAAHPNAPYVVLLKLGVPGATLLGGTQNYPVATLQPDPTDGQYALLTVTGGYWFYTAEPWTVTLTGTDASGVGGLSDGISYAATLRSLTELRIFHGGSLSGSYGGGVTVKVPRWSWRKTATVGAIWPYLTAAWSQLQALLEADGRYPDVRGIVIPGLGLNDALAGNNTANWQAGYEELLANLRDLFTTRSSPSPVLPIAASRLKTYAYNNGDATVAAAVSTINAAIDSVAISDTAFAAHSLDAADGNESDKERFPMSSDKVHLTGDGVLEQGWELWDTLASIDQSCANVEGAASGSSGSSSIEAVS